MSATDPETNVPLEQTPYAAPSAPAASLGDVPSDSIILIETGVVILMAVLPSLYRSIRYFYATTSGSPNTIYDDFEVTLTNCAQVTIPVLFIIWRSGEHWSSFGIVPVKWLRDFFLMIAACFASMLFAATIQWSVYDLLWNSQYRRLIVWHKAVTFRSPQQPGDYLLVILLCCLIGFGEELLFRSYLIVRLERIFKSTFGAVLLSSLLFGAGHIYQGWDGVIAQTAIGFIYALFFVRYRCLWPLAAAHALMDFRFYIRLH